MKTWLRLLLALTIPVSWVACGLLAGCETGYTSGTGLGLSGNFTGLYSSPTGGVLVTGNTGQLVTFLNLTQSGTDVTAVDNNSITFQGTLSVVDSTSATVTLQGATTAGAAVTIHASLSASGSTGILTGTWIEPTLSSALYGTAIITAF